MTRPCLPRGRLHDAPLFVAAMRATLGHVDHSADSRCLVPQGTALSGEMRHGVTVNLTRPPLAPASRSGLFFFAHARMAGSGRHRRAFSLPHPLSPWRDAPSPP